MLQQLLANPADASQLTQVRARLASLRDAFSIRSLALMDRHGNVVLVEPGTASLMGDLTTDLQYRPCFPSRF